MWFFGIFMYLFNSYAFTYWFPPTYLDSTIVSSCVFCSLFPYVLLVCSNFSLLLNVCWVLHRNYITNV